MNIVDTPRTLLVALALLAGTAAFGASTYDMEAQKVDAAMTSAKMTPSSTDEVRKLRSESARMMKEGKEKEAMQLLEQVKKLLGMAK